MTSTRISHARYISYVPADPHEDSAGLGAITLGEARPEAGAARTAPSYPTERSILAADALAVSLKGALDRLAVPLARAASAFRRQSGWFLFGYARLSDYSRERVGCTSRWFGDLAHLGDRLDELEGLAAALTGDDGGRPIGRAAAIAIARIASAESLGAWVELARCVGARELREAVGRARAAGSTWPVEPAGAGGHDEMRVEQSGVDPDEEDPDDGRYLKWFMPAPVAAAFDEALDLFRAVEGGEATIADFAEALVADAMAGPAGSEIEVDVRELNRVEGRARIEGALAHSTDNWSHLPEAGQTDWALALAGASLGQFMKLCERAGRGDAVELDDQIGQLAGLEHELERRLAEILARMADQSAWSRLGFDSTAHYAEQRLGQSRTALQDRARLWRALRRLPLVRRAFEQGEIGFEAARCVVRALGNGIVDEGIQRAWVQRSKEASIKRLRDEQRAIRRDRAFRQTAAANPSDPMPLTDTQWRESIRREPGMAKDRVAKLGDLAASSLMSDVFLRLRLPAVTAGRLMAAVEGARRRLGRLVEQVPWDQPWPQSDAPASIKAARDLFIRCRRIPSWLGLLALLEDFVATWDVSPKRRGDEIYIRAGWRCMAPGCTSRRHLEDHHLDYRSRGGGHDEANRECLCRFHHQCGEHGGLASCRGQAPLDVVWRLGRQDVGT
ncbi:MAG TPA: HNH endonuclease signature motif containing protein, partial [Candidatus Polarisedimenticolia bacterium]